MHDVTELVVKGTHHTLRCAAFFGDCRAVLSGQIDVASLKHDNSDHLQLFTFNVFIGSALFAFEILNFAVFTCFWVRVMLRRLASLTY